MEDNCCAPKICVLGLGYIGLPTAALLATNGFAVVGVDVNPAVVNAVNRAAVPIAEPGLATVLKAAVHSGNLVARSEPEPAEAFIVAVPTPVTEDKKADLSYIAQAAESIRPLLVPGNLVILESTSPPGTTIDVLVPILERSGLVVGQDLLVAHCPERVLPGRILKELMGNDRVIGGLTMESAEAAKAIYARFVEGQIHLTDATTAEMVKLMENTYRDVNIALANELAVICAELGISAWEVTRLANLHPRVDLHQPGPGVGGHCLAVDPWFIVEKFPGEARLIELARRTNDAMPGYVVSRVKEALAGLPEPQVTLLGVSYKGNVTDTRESPALGIICGLEEAGIGYRLYDPHVTDFPYELSSLPEAFRGADLVLVVADHEEFKFLHPGELGKLMRRRLVFDTRNFLDHDLWRAAGFEVHVLGAGKDRPSEVKLVALGAR